MTTRTTLALTLLALTIATAGRADTPGRFVLYRVRPSAGTAPFEPIGPVQLTDDIASQPYSVTKPRQLAMPEAASATAPSAGVGLVEYAITAPRGAAPIGKRSRVPAADQCGDVTVTLKEPTSLLVPATVDPHGMAAPPDPDTADLDHFLCYKASAETRRPDGTRLPKLARGTQMDVADAFGTRRYDLLGISKVCRPVDKDVDPENPPKVLAGPDAGQTKLIAPAPIGDPGRYLVCYRARVATTYVAQTGCGPSDPHDRGTPLGQAATARAGDVSTADQLGSLRHDTIKATEICLPSGPRDADHDGVEDSSDPCPQTTPGAAQVIPGCSALDLTQNTDNVLVPLRMNAKATLEHIEEFPDLEGAAQEIQDALPEFDEAVRETRAADPCAGRLRANTGQAHFASALRLVEQVRAVAESEAHMSRPDMVDADDTPESERLMEMDFVRTWANGLVTDAQRVIAALGAVCDVSTPVHVRGVVRAMHDDQRRIELDDGRVFGIADPILLETPLGPGQTVDISGLGLGPQEGLGDQVSPGSGWQIPKATYVECLQLRVAPIQRFAPISKGPYMLHDADAYDVGGTLLLEHGMRLAVVDICKPSVNPSLSFAKYSLRIDATETGTFQKTTLAGALGAGDPPVGIGSYGAGTLTVHHQAQTCQLLIGQPMQCDSPVDTSVETLQYVAVPDGSLCKVDYSSILVDVNDQIPSDWRSVHAENVTTVDMNDPNTSPVFEAEGYPVDQGVSSYPTILPVVGSQEFAIRNYDFFPVFYRPLAGFNDLDPLYGKMMSGVDHPAGLAWPHVHGKHDGHDWQYSCQLDKMIRDVVNFCPGHTAFFRLPFAPEDTSWKIGQGNLPNCPDNKNNPQGTCAKSGTDYCTHGGGYAYDMTAPCLTPFRAARGGRVIQLDASQTKNSNSNCPVTNDPCGTTTTCDPNASGNVLWIEHQDGTVVRYVHPNQNKILPKLGDYVKRGQLVGYVGMTGFTSGPHMHFGPYPKFGASSSLGLFEAVDPDTNKVLKCFEPRADGPSDTTCYGITAKAMRSNNKKQ